MKKNVLLIVLFQLIFMPMLAQMEYPIMGQYKKKSAQGMAINGDYAYLFNDGGLCRKLNLLTGKVVGEFMLESAAKTTHVNSACFSTQYVEGYSDPAIYITEFYGKRRCFVEVIGGDSSKLVQTIEYKDTQGKNPFVRAWIVDNKEKKLYAVIREKNREKSNVIKQFPLPKLSAGREIVLTENDVLDKFTVDFVNGVQGGKIKDKKIYLTVGFSSVQGKGEYFDRAIKVIDLKKKKLIQSIDLTKVTVNEPEDIDYYNGKCLLFAGGTGGIYHAF